MKKILISFCFLILFECSGYKPIFATKDLTFFISEIENTDNNKITKKIINNLRSYKLENTNKKGYSLKIISAENNKVTSRDSKGDPLTYRLEISVETKIFNDNSNLLLNTLKIKKDFVYNYQINQFELGQYKKNIIENLIVKISEEIIFELQLM